MRSIVAAMALALSLSSVAQAEPKDDAHATLEHWAAAFNAGKPDEVAGLYTADAMLWGTISPALTSTPAAIKAYFAAAAAARVNVRLGDHSATEISDRVVVDAGQYEFERAKDGQTVVFPARYSFVLVKQGDRWMIAHHHSSAMPRP